jgi:hypothetical protein
LKRRWLALVLVVNLAGLLALAVAYPHLMVSPGPLVQGHADLTTDCFACHAPWRGAAARLCVDCHALPDIGVRATQGQPIAVPSSRGSLRASFHQDLIQQDCMACHSDHQGSSLTRKSRKVFSHALLRPAAREHCAGCHQAPADDLHRKTQGECGTCHTVQRWTPATFEHAQLFVLDRDHDAPCATCHKARDFSSYTCYGCHEHTVAKVRAEHVKEGIDNFENCVECHRDPGVEPEKPRSSKDRRKREKD